jgi:hypothetical protein
VLSNRVDRDRERAGIHCLQPSSLLLHHDKNARENSKKSLLHTTICERSCASDLSSRPLKAASTTALASESRCRWLPVASKMRTSLLAAVRAAYYLACPGGISQGTGLLDTPAHGKLLPARGSYRRCSFPPATLCDFAMQPAPVKNLVGIDAVPLRDTGTEVPGSNVSSTILHWPVPIQLEICALPESRFLVGY